MPRQSGDGRPARDAPGDGLRQSRPRSAPTRTYPRSDPFPGIGQEGFVYDRQDSKRLVSICPTQELCDQATQAAIRHDQYGYSQALAGC